MEKKRIFAIACSIITALLALFAFIAKTPLFGFALIVCTILLFRKPKPKENPSVNLPATEPIEATVRTPYSPPKYKYVEYKLAGVTYKDGRMSRQAALRAIKFEEPPYYDHPELTAEIEEYEGKPAVAIKANGRMLGYIPKNRISEFMADFPNFCQICDIKVIGKKQEDGTWLNGAIITVEVKNNEAPRE